MCVLLCTATSSRAMGSLMMHAGREREAGRTELLHCYHNGGSEQPHIGIKYNHTCLRPFPCGIVSYSLSAQLELLVIKSLF